MWKFNRRTRPKSTGSGKPRRMAAGVLAVAVAAVALTAAPASAGHNDRGRSNDWRGDRGRHSQHDRGRHYGHRDHYHGHHHNHGHGQVIIDYRPAPACRYIPGRYEERTRRVLVRPAHYDKVWHEPEFGFRYDSHGHRVRFVITQGHYDSVYHPAEYRTECVRVWVPARWVCASGCSHPHHH